jgi:hypothetical protein
MSGERAVPETARRLAGELVEAFGEDQALAERQAEAQHQWQAANDRLWSGVHPDALGVVYANAAAAAGGSSEVVGALGDALDGGLPAAEVQAAVLVVLQQVHWALHRAFCDYQTLCEDRRHLAAEIGELAAGMVAALVAAGWSETQARQADVHQLAGAGAAQ